MALPQSIAGEVDGWPIAIQEEAKFPDLSEIQVKALPSGTWNLDHPGGSRGCMNGE